MKYIEDKDLNDEELTLYRTPLKRPAIRSKERKEVLATNPLISYISWEEGLN